MKIPFTKNLLAFLLLATASASFADDSKPPADQRRKEFLSATTISKEQREKVLVSFTLESSDPDGDRCIRFRLHNGLPDSAVVGIVFSVTSKDPASGKERSIDYVGYCHDGMPLEISEGWVPLFQPFEGKTEGSVATIKEVRVRRMTD